MSIARHHAEWLSLIEVSGPFLSLPVLKTAFPQGLPARDPEASRETRLRFEEWQNQQADRAVHRRWCEFVLGAVLHLPPETLAEGAAIPPGMEARIAEFGEVLRPDFAMVPPAGAGSKKPRMLIQLCPPDQDLEKPLKDRHWKASPATRMTELLHAADVRLGLITNGEHWMLVQAPRGETTGFASWYAPLWFEEPLTFQAFRALLGVQRFFGVPEKETLEALLTASAQDQQEVTEQLGWQVRRAVEVLIQAFDRLDQDSNRQLLAGVDEKQLYEAALTVMMRLVFLFAAEERGLLLLGDPLYDQHYAVSTLRDQLQEAADKHVEEVLDARFDAWSRLLATFRTVYGGVQHEAMRLPPYGGNLFHPDRFPFLEGRRTGTDWHTSPAEPLKISNRTVLHLLNALQVLQVKVAGGGPAEARRLSFRALDIEQIGHVYEGLLDHTAVRTAEPVLGLKGPKDSEPEVPLSKLESLACVVPMPPPSVSESTQPFLLAADAAANVISLPTAKGSTAYSPPDRLIEFLKEETGRSANAIKKALTDQSGVDESRLLLACGHDRDLLDRVWRFAPLLRDDTFGLPVVIRAGSIYVTQGTTRRSTGTHYTPRSLTEPIVRYTLEPLLYVGPAEGTPKENWQLKSPREILELKVCDMAMGSGAFLVQACRYLGERLVEAWENAEKAHPGQFITTPEGDLSSASPSERLLPSDAAERLAIARRYIADRCLYGVDINQMAVEMAKLSLWLITLQRDRPFTFLDHSLKCGDSLLGVNSIKQIENFSLRAKEGDRVQHTFATANLSRLVDEATEKRRALENLPSNDHTQIEAKNRLHAEAEAATAKVKALADCLIAFESRGLDGEEYGIQRAVAADNAEAAMRKPLLQFEVYARDQLHGRRPVHWPVAFPEVFQRGGFDAFVGNPPFVGGKRISTFFGEAYARALAVLVPESNANADLSVKFHLRACRLIHPAATYGLLATDRIAEGDTRQGGLEQVLKLGGKIFCAQTSRQWPGDAAVRYSAIHVYFGNYRSMCLLNGQEATGIDSALLPESEKMLAPKSLMKSWGTSYVGCAIQGAGFILKSSEANALLKVKSNSVVVRPFLIANDLNHVPDQRPRRWIINFDDRSLSAASAFPQCLEIVQSRVKPHRDTVNRKAHREKWWQFGDRRPGLVADCSKRQEVLACAMTTVDFKFALVPADWVFDQTVVVIIPNVAACYAVLESSIHKAWAYEFGSGFGSGGAPRYNPSRCFETFPFPGEPDRERVDAVAAIGASYLSHRGRMMLSRQEGLTKSYSRFHDTNEQSEDIARLRALQVEMDKIVATAYGWSCLDLDHGFHETKQGVRFTISESARRTVLDRLLALNHQRYEEEVRAGLHEMKPKKAKRARHAPAGGTPTQGDLIAPPQGELFA